VLPVFFTWLLASKEQRISRAGAMKSIMRKHRQNAFLCHIALALFLACIGSVSHAEDLDEFDDLTCVKYVVIVDKLVQLRDDGFPKSMAYQEANDMNVMMFSQAVASVYEFQKGMNRDELDIYALGWCEGQSDAINENDNGADPVPELVRLKPHRPRKSANQ